MSAALDWIMLGVAQSLLLNLAFNAFSRMGWSAFVAALILSVFVFWGWSAIRGGAIGP